MNDVNTATAADPDGARPAEDCDSFLRAVYLARRRRFDQARQALALAAAEGCSPARIHDLNARMFAQQGRPLDADAHWRQAQESEPANPVYAEARSRLRAVRYRRVSPVWAAGGLVAGLGLLWLVGQNARQADAARLAAIERAMAGLSEQVAGSQSSLAAGLDAAEARLGTVIAKSAQAAERKVAAWGEQMTASRTEIALILQSNQAQLREAIADKPPETSGLGERLDQIKDAEGARAAALGQAVTALSEQVDGLRRQLAADRLSIETKLGSETQGLATGNAVTGLHERIAALASVVTDATKDLREQLQVLARAEDTADLGTRLTQLERQVEQLARQAPPAKHYSRLPAVEPARRGDSAPAANTSDAK
jgi:hypothetical protein